MGILTNFLIEDEELIVDMAVLEDWEAVPFPDDRDD